MEKQTLYLINLGGNKDCNSQITVQTTIKYAINYSIITKKAPYGRVLGGGDKKTSEEFTACCRRRLKRISMWGGGLWLNFK